MKNKLKSIFANAKVKINSLKIVTSIKNFFNTIFKNEKVQNATNIVTKNAEDIKNSTKTFMDSHDNIKDIVSGNVMHRFQQFFSKFGKRFRKSIVTRNENCKVKNFGKKCARVLCILLSLGFAGLVIYCIKDVFLYCLMLVATCAAVMVCIELIFSVLSIAFAQKV